MNSSSKANIKKRNNKFRKNKEIKQNESEIIHKKAVRLIYGLRWGRGATAKAEKMLNDALGTRCHWCGNKLTCENISMDHKNPLIRPIQRTPRQLALLNSPKNLRVICQKCNFLKNAIPESRFQKLMDFLNTDRKLKRIILSALYFSNSKYSGYIQFETEYNFKTGFLGKPKK